MIIHNALVLREHFGLEIAAKYLKAHGFSFGNAMFILLGKLTEEI